MGYDLRLPNIKGATEKERLTQVESYLRQLVEQLQWAMNSLEVVSANGVNNTMKTASKGSSQALEKAVDANATFNAIKHLIIKSADIVSAYYDEINKKLVGEYVAISDFGTFREQTEQNIEANSQWIEQSFSNIQAIESNIQIVNDTLSSEIQNVGISVENVNSTLSANIEAVASNAANEVENAKAALRDSIDDKASEIASEIEDVSSTLSNNIDSVSQKAASDIESISSSLRESLDELSDVVGGIDAYVLDVKAHIRSGQIDTIGGVPVFGIEVGQKILKDGVEVYEKFARFTSSKLSFYDHNDVEVAYVSDRQLYISNVCVLVSYKIGGIMDIVQPNGDVVTMWVGIGGDS